MNVNGRDPKSCLDQVLNFKLVCFIHIVTAKAKTLTSGVKNLAKVFICKFKFVHA